MNVFKIIEDEVSDYLTGTVETSEGVSHSEYRLKKRIQLFKNRIYPKGKTTKQGGYKYWPDIIKPRVDSEVKNLRIDTKSFLIFSQDPQGDFAATYIANAKAKDWMWDTGRAEELNDVVESYSGDGNILLKKIKGGYEVTDPANTYIVNQTAKTVDDTAIIERHQLTQSELRAKDGTWENVDYVIKNLGDHQYKAEERSTSEETTNPYYEIFERNGEISEKDLFEAQGLEGAENKGSEDKYVLAKIIVAGCGATEDEKTVLWAKQLAKNKKMSDIYKEAHRGPYKGKWWREGLYELLFDYQVRANEIANQLARGLEWASKVVFASSDKLIVQNILTDIANGDIIKTQDLRQVDVRMQGFDQLINDWNRNIQEADRIANSFEITRGESQPAGTPFRLAERLNMNNNSLFIFLRQKLGNMYKQVWKDWVLPELVRELKSEEIIRVVGDTDILDELRQMQVDKWYIDNLVNIGPHTKEMADEIKRLKLEELKQKDPTIKNIKEIWDGVLPRLFVTITGENMDLEEQLTTLSSLVGLETDPLRRAWVLDRIYKIKGLPVPPATPIIPENQLPAATPSLGAEPVPGGLPLS